MWTLNWIHYELIWKWCCLRFRLHSHMNEKTTVKNYFGIQQDVDNGTGEKCIYALNLNGYLHFLLASHISYVNRNFKFHWEREIHWFGSVHTAQRQTPTEILIGFCANLPLSVSVFVSSSVNTLLFVLNVTCWQWPWTSRRGTVQRGSIHWPPDSRLCCWKQKQVFLRQVVRQEPLLCHDFPQRKWHPLAGSRIGTQVESGMMKNTCCWLPAKYWNFSLVRINMDQS